jgi:HYR domain
MLAEADSSDGAYVEYPQPTATDDNGEPFVSCFPHSGDLFPVGTTRVTCTAEDWETGEQSSASFSVRVLAPAQERSSKAGTTALLHYTKTTDSYGLTVFKNLRLTIVRLGQVLMQARIRPWRSQPASQPAGYEDQKSIAVRDLDVDGEQEVVLDLYSGGAHCCFWSEVYRYTGTGYLPRRHMWADAGYRVVDLGKDGFPELLSADYRFAYAFTSFADSAFPLQIWSYDRGSFVDVTFHYRSQIRRDAAHWLSSARRRNYANGGAYAAWAADQALLGNRAAAFRRLRALARSGRLTSDYRPQVYLRRLARLLNQLDYR